MNVQLYQKCHYFHLFPFDLIMNAVYFGNTFSSNQTRLRLICTVLFNNLNVNSVESGGCGAHFINFSHQFIFINIILSISFNQFHLINFMLSISCYQFSCYQFHVINFICYQIHFINFLLSISCHQFHVINFILSISYLINFILSISFYQFHFINFILSISFYQFHFINFILSISFYQFHFNNFKFILYTLELISSKYSKFSHSGWKSPIFQLYGSCEEFY
jgi:hypothetical protein